jgi:hypothetical protein
MGKKKKIDQVSRGELNPSQEPETTDSTLQEKKDSWPLGGATGELDPREIQPFTGIPDYLEPTRSPNPIVVKSKGVCQCIDGWELVNKALADGRSTLLCYIFQASSDSPTEIALRKVAIRVLPQGGKSSYAETMRNVSIAFKMLASSQENPIVYSHGGARRGSNFTSNREENIRLVLAERLEKSPTTISKYLNHAEYLSDEAISALVQAGADKEFFEDTQIVKRKLLTNLKSSGITEDEISAQVSEAMLRMHQNEAEIENYKKTLFYAPEEDKPTEQTAKTPPLATEPERPVTFKHWGGAEKSLPEQPVDGDDLRREITAIAQRMMSQSQDRNMPLPSLKESIMADIGELLSLLQKIGEAEDSPGKEGE